MAILPSNSSYQKITLISNIVLYFPFYTPSGDITISDIMDVEPDQDGWKIILPNATLAQPGTNFLINNISVNSFKIMLNDGTTELLTVAAGEIKFVNLTNNTISNGTWAVMPFGGGQNAITSLTAESSDASLIINNGVVIPPGGTVDFRLTGLLTNLINLSTGGFPVITEYPEWDVRNFVEGSNIIITNSDGKLGNPIVSLNNTVAGLSSVEIGDLTISGSIVTNNVNNGGVDIVSNGTGDVNLNGVIIDTNNNISNVNNLTINGTLNNPLLPKSWCVFTDTITGSSNTVVVENSENVANITGSNGSYVITFNSPMISINYGVIISLGSSGSSLPPPVYNAFWTVRELTSLSITVLDASGEFVESVPSGVSVVII